MLFGIIAAVAGAVSLGAAVRLKEQHVQVNNLLSELDSKGAASPGALAPSDTAVPADVLFTESLLALNRVGLRVPGDSPALVPDEASSLVSVRPAQSKNRLQAL